MPRKKRDPIVHIKDGVWYRCEDSYTHFCCDCLMSHQKEVKLENGILWERWIRRDGQTRAQRRKHGIRIIRDRS